MAGKIPDTLTRDQRRWRRSSAPSERSSEGGPLVKS